ncbi:ABC transporter permease [Paenibacillus sp. NPDC058071]|uniref:ABC transporter permease n=1 Tax=Paenibacillus sp. NPDC058071 TaxID=3346326 RepID=UPI0036D88A87
MIMAWKEMKRSKAKFMILGSIVFLVSLLTFLISGLANGLSQDNSALIKDLPDGRFYMDKDAEGTYSFSRIEPAAQEAAIKEGNGAAALSIQMGFVVDKNGRQHGAAFVASTESEQFFRSKPGEIVLDRSLEKEGIQIGDRLTNRQSDGEWTVTGFVDGKKFSHAPVAYIAVEDYQSMYRAEGMQMLFVPDKDGLKTVPDGLQAYSNKQFLDSIPSYKAEQMSLNMMIWFLIVISGMLFAIFFYMMNVQKIGLYGILKAIGVRTSTLFGMIWTQMLIVTVAALALSILLSQLFDLFGPEGMPFQLTLNATVMLSLLFLVIGLLGATLSGWQIRKVEPLTAIQQGEV